MLHRRPYYLVAFPVAFLAVFAWAGCDTGGPHRSTPSAAASAAPSGPRVIDVTAGDRGFSPSSIDVKRGESVILRFTRTTNSGCLSTVSFPDLSLNKELPLNVPVDIALTPDKEGYILFECGMSMIRGRLVVGST